ncbi:hypothetical protein LF817_03280 [Halobacillus sp. A1]|uniref:hypothetical protein n=1 Tax=Halobacillus sp. A1 TaxID=2880262 RepID=UPI0020A6A422|nr:hypothetical protein [Halobacillus sp. A1]MCP3030356.1 hypothetical protein [Halobacillus sp. A1]
MTDLIEMITSNILIVAAIIGGLISWFSGMSKEDENQKKRAPKQPRPTMTPSGPAERSAQKETRTQVEDAVKESKGRVESYYEEKQKRLEEAADYQNDRNRQSLSFDQRTLDGDNLEVYIEKGKETKKPNLKYSSRWSRNKLAEGIIMAEILGQPRAYKPHSSHPRKR